MFGYALWLVEQAIYERCLIFSIWDVLLVYTISLSHLSFFVIFLVCVIFPLYCIIKQITSTHYFFWYFHMEAWSHYTLIKLSHSGIDCFAIHLVNALYPTLISWIFIYIFEHIIWLMWNEKVCMLISEGLKMYHV